MCLWLGLQLEDQQYAYPHEPLWTCADCLLQTAHSSECEWRGGIDYNTSYRAPEEEDLTTKEPALVPQAANGLCPWCSTEGF